MLKEQDRLEMLNTEKVAIFEMRNQHEFYRNINDFLEGHWYDQVEDERWYKKIDRIEIFNDNMIVFWRWS